MPSVIHDQTPKHGQRAVLRMDDVACPGLKMENMFILVGWDRYHYHNKQAQTEKEK